VDRPRDDTERQALDDVAQAAAVEAATAAPLRALCAAADRATALTIPAEAVAAAAGMSRATLFRKRPPARSLPPDPQPPEADRV
jgi:hypothetical protein